MGNRFLSSGPKFVGEGDEEKYKLMCKLPGKS